MLLGGFPWDCFEGECGRDPACVLKGCKMVPNQTSNYKITTGRVCVCSGTACTGECVTWRDQTADEIVDAINDAMHMKINAVEFSRACNGLLSRGDPLSTREVTNRHARRARAAQERRK